MFRRAVRCVLSSVIARQSPQISRNAFRNPQILQCSKSFVSSKEDGKSPTAPESRDGALNVPSWLEALRTEFVENIQNNSATKNTYDIRISEPSTWGATSFRFPEESWNPNEMTDVSKRRLCLGDQEKLYTQIGEVLTFPSAADHPIIHESNETAKIWWDNGSPTPKVLVQLNEHVPPLLWISIAPKLKAINTLCEEFLQIDTRCMQKNLDEAEKSHKNYLEQLGAESSDVSSKKHQLKDLYLNELRQKDPSTFGVDWENDFCVYIGSYGSLATLEREWMRKNPFVFGWPLLLSDGNTHMENRPSLLAAFRTLMSKSILLIVSRRDLLLHHQTGEVAESLTSEVPMFCYINYPKNRCLSGGQAFVRRFNETMGTKLPLDIPVDVLAVLAREGMIRTSAQLFDEINQLDETIKTGPPRERHPRLPEILHSSTRVTGQLAYNIIYLACMQYPNWDAIFARFANHPDAAIRLALATGSSIFQREDLVTSLIEQEKDDAVKASMSKYQGRE